MPSRLEVVGTEDVQSARKKQKPSDLQTASKYPDRQSQVTLIVRVQCQPNQRAGTDRHTEPGYLLTGSRPGHAAPDAGAAVLLLPLIKVAPECAVNALDAGAIYECVTVTLDVQTNRHTR